MAYSVAATKSGTENEALEFILKELQCLDQGKSKRELERDSRNEGCGQQEDVDFTIGQTVELDHKPNLIPKRGRIKKIIQVEDGSDYWEREKLQPLEKVQENDIVRNKVEPKEEERVKKLMYVEDPKRIQVTGREREKQQGLPELKSQKRAKNAIYIQDPESMQHIDLKRRQGQQMSQPNIGMKKVAGPNNIEKHQSKKEYSLRSKHNIKASTVLEISHSGECLQHTMNEERLISDQNKNPSVFPKTNDPNLTANGGNGYDHNDRQYGRYGYDHQTDDQHDGDGYDHNDSQYGRYGCDHQADNQHDGNGYGHVDYQYSGKECNHRADDQYGGCRSDQADNEGYGVSRRIGSNERHHFCGNDSYIYSKYFWGNHQNSTNMQQPKQNQSIGRGGMNIYNADLIHCDYIPYNACFTGIYCIISLFR